jgi:L-seryl-tRNA(Ser) seleniumtransferase
LLTRAAGEIQAQAQRLLPPFLAAIGDCYEVAATPMTSQIGSGALPVEALPSHGLRVRSIGRRGNLQKLESRLRALPRPMIVRCADKALWLDMRCMESDQEGEFLQQLSSLGR